MIFTQLCSLFGSRGRPTQLVIQIIAVIINSSSGQGCRLRAIHELNVNITILGRVLFVLKQNAHGPLNLVVNRLRRIRQIDNFQGYLHCVNRQIGTPRFRQFRFGKFQTWQRERLANT